MTAIFGLDGKEMFVLDLLNEVFWTSWLISLSTKTEASSKAQAGLSLNVCILVETNVQLEIKVFKSIDSLNSFETISKCSWSIVCPITSSIFFDLILSMKERISSKVFFEVWNIKPSSSENKNLDNSFFVFSVFNLKPTLPDIIISIKQLTNPPSDISW